MNNEGIKPDTRGPKNIAIILFFSALLLAGFSYQDWLQHQGGLTDSQVDTFLATPNSQGGEPTSVDDFRAFEDEVQTNKGYLIRSIGLAIATICLLIGTPLLHRLNINGAYLCVTGAVLGLISGVYGSYLINDSAQMHLGDAMMLTYEIWVYLCGAIMSLCLAVTALPLLNTKARMALNLQVIVVQDESVNDEIQRLQQTVTRAELEKTHMQDELEKAKSTTVVQNITYNIQDSAIAGDINATGLKEKDD